MCIFLHVCHTCRAVPVLILSGSAGVRACMGVLSPAIRSGMHVKISQSWCTNGSSEPVRSTDCDTTWVFSNWQNPIYHFFWHWQTPCMPIPYIYVHIHIEIAWQHVHVDFFEIGQIHTYQSNIYVYIYLSIYIFHILFVNKCSLILQQHGAETWRTGVETQ